MFNRYKSKPVEIEAVRFTDKDKDRIFTAISGSPIADRDADGKPIIKIRTMHGEYATVKIGDWIIKDADIGTYYPCVHEEFIKRYEVME